MKQHYLQIDVLKGLAIIAVLVLHSSTKAELFNTYAVYHVWQAVPLFMVIMGLNLGLGLKEKQQQLKDLFTAHYFHKKASRILVPFLLVFLIAYALGLIWKLVFEKDVLTFNLLSLAGLLPVPGNGNYFITLLLQSILFLPLLGYFFQRAPLITTVILILLEAAFLLWSYQVDYFNKENYLYSAAFPRYFSAIAYGYWLAQLLLDRRKYKILVAVITSGVIGIIFLYMMSYTKFDIPVIRADWDMQNFLSFGYAALLVYLGLMLFPVSSQNKVLYFLASLGKASYHVFLIQVVYFGLMPDRAPLVQNVLFCLGLGYVFYILEKPLGFPHKKIERVANKA